MGIDIYITNTKPTLSRDIHVKPDQIPTFGMKPLAFETIDLSGGDSYCISLPKGSYNFEEEQGRQRLVGDGQDERRLPRPLDAVMAEQRLVIDPKCLSEEDRQRLLELDGTTVFVAVKYGCGRGQILGLKRGMHVTAFEDAVYMEARQPRLVRWVEPK